MRLTVAAAVSCLLFTSLSAAPYAAAAIRKETHIPPQSLDSALQVFAQDRKLQLVYATDEVGRLSSPGATGDLTADDALKQLLNGTGLSYQFLDEDTVTVAPTAPPRRVKIGGSAGVNAPLSASGSGEETRGLSQSAETDEGPGSNLRDRLRLAQAQTGSMLAATGESATLEGPVQLDEVLVTAQKKGQAERLQDVPVPMSVISAQALMQSNKAQVQDYFDQVPGLMVADPGVGFTIVSIRGVTTGQNTSPTVGYTLDDVPLGGSTNANALGQIPVINPADLAQIEVLRGPQGTIYGDNSMGGLIRYVTVDPSTERIFGDVTAGTSSVLNGTHVGYSTSAAINLPLTDTLAIRTSAFTRLDPGYADNAETGARGEGLKKSGGGRAAGMWTPSSDFSLKLSVLYEKSDRYGSSDLTIPTTGYPFTARLGDLQQYSIPQSGGYSEEFKTGNLTLNANLGAAKLTSISGYTVNGYKTTVDFSYAVEPPPNSLYGAPLIEDNEMHKFTQEVRITDTIGSHLEWLLGGFYTQEDSRYIEYASLATLSSGAVIAPASFYYSNSPGRYREYAGFGGLTVKVTEPFDVQVGARKTFLSNPYIDQGSYTGGSLLKEPSGPSVYTPHSTETYKANALTYLITPRLRLSPDLMVYARVANGFRPGGGAVNPASTDQCVKRNYQCLISPDKTTDYEVGAKADFFNHAFSIDSSVYYIRWTDVQLELTDPSDHLNFPGNGSGAKSQGVDLAVNWRPIEGFTVSSWGAWNDAKLTRSFAFGAAGQPMPFAPRFSGNFSMERELLLTDSIHAFLGVKEIYMGERLGSFTNLSGPRQVLPAYSQTDVDTGIKFDGWTFSLYVNNATDRRGQLFGGLGGTIAPYTFDYITPRTVGLSIDRAL